MRKSAALMDWDASLTSYLASRRALGRRYAGEERVLRTVRTTLLRAGLKDLDAATFDRWRRRWRHCAHNTQRDYSTIVLRFCRYRRRRDARCFLPDATSLLRRRPYPLPSPIDARQVAALLRFVATQRIPRDRTLRRPAVRLAIVLMFTAGLRRGEVAHLRLDDVDARAGVLRIRASKFHKSRWVPLSVSATRELRAYLDRRRVIVRDRCITAPLLWSCATAHYTPGGISSAVKDAMVRSGIWRSARRLARVHDFRHGFAVAALKRWYEAGADVQSALPKLAIYMGHVSIASTTYYLRFMPAVVALAGERFARACGDLVDGGAP
jgi:integrase/recombinase XerD